MRVRIMGHAMRGARMANETADAKLRRDTYEGHGGGEAGLQFFALSPPWGHDAPLWPYFPDVKIERFHYMAKSGVLSQQINTFMHCTTHTDAPAHVVEGTRFMDEVPLSSYFGSGVVVSLPTEKWAA